MNLFGWWNKKKADKTINLEFQKEEKDICSGQGYSINDNHYLADDDYEKIFQL